MGAGGGMKPSHDLIAGPHLATPLPQHSYFNKLLISMLVNKISNKIIKCNPIVLIR